MGTRRLFDRGVLRVLLAFRIHSADPAGRHGLGPRIYGEIYTYKPALAYWLAAIAHSVTDPPPEWLIRLPFATAMFATGLIVLLVLRRLVGNRAAALSAIATISGGIVIEKVKLAEFDGILAAGVGIAIVAACHNLSARQASGTMWVLGYVGLTIGFLAKGIPALMVYGPGLLAAGWATRRLRRLVNWRHLGAASIFLALTGGYLVGVYRSAGPAAFEQPITESAIRGLGWLQSPESSAVSAEATGFRLPPDEAKVARNPLAAFARTITKPALVLVGFLPWSLLVPFAFRRKAAGRVTRETDFLVRAAGAFLIAGVLVFMAVPTHSMRYYMPLSVPVGILAGILASGQLALGPKKQRGMLITSATGAILIAALTIAGGFLLESPPVAFSHRALLVVIGVFALGVAALAIRAREREPIPKLLIIAAFCVICTHALGVQVLRESKRNLRGTAQALASYLPENEPVWVLGPSDLAGKNSSLFFYLRRPILAFRPRGKHPPADSHCILTSDRMSELEQPPGFVFDEITRVEHIWRTFLLGRCSWPRSD